MGSLPKSTSFSSVRESRQAAKLEDAKIVVAGGRGVKEFGGIQLHQGAGLFSGRRGRSHPRPAVDSHWTSHEQLIGQTGASIKPELLITCGTSARFNILLALEEQEPLWRLTVTRAQPIFKFADIGVVGDALSFLPAFIMEVKNHVFQEIADLYRRSGKDWQGSEVGFLRTAD